MSKASKNLKIAKAQPVELEKYDPDSKGELDGKKEGKKQLAQLHEELNELQQVLYAESKRSLLVVLQAMDTGGKDGTIRHVFGPMNPQGVRVTNFKVPTDEELAHDYLWRIHRAVPQKGMIGIFNRSHYEDVLVTRVHKLVPSKTIEQRYKQINAFEKHLAQNDVTVLKFFLHISKEEQKERLQSRLNRPDKHWKFSSADIRERAIWDDYVAAYEKMLSKCSTSWAPWYIVPANHKWVRNVIVAEIVRDTLKSLKLEYPPAEPGLADIKIKD